MSESMSFDDLQKECKGALNYMCQNPRCGKKFGTRARPNRDANKFCSSQCASYYISYKTQERQTVLF